VSSLMRDSRCKCSAVRKCILTADMSIFLSPTADMMMIVTGDATAGRLHASGAEVAARSAALALRLGTRKGRPVMAPTMPSGLWLVAPTNLNEKLVRSGTGWAAEGKGDGIVGMRETYRRRAVATGNSVTRAEMVQTCAVKSVPRAFGTEGDKKFGGARRRLGWQKSVCVSGTAGAKDGSTRVSCAGVNLMFLASQMA
jgi:hypothetical protein